MTGLAAGYYSLCGKIYREGGLRAGKVGLQLGAVGAIAHKGQMGGGAERFEDGPQRLQVLLCSLINQHQSLSDSQISIPRSAGRTAEPFADWTDLQRLQA